MLPVFQTLCFRPNSFSSQNGKICPVTGISSPGEGDIGVCGVVVLLSFLCGIPVIKIPHCGVAVIPNRTVCDVRAFKPTVLGETKLFAVLRHQQYQHCLNADHAL